MMLYTDVKLDDNGDLPLGDPDPFLSGVDLVAQRIRVRLRTYRGEPITAVGEGLRFAEWASSKPPDLDSISAEVKSDILAIDGVVRVEDFEIGHNRATRSISISFTAATSFAESVTASGEIPISTNSTPIAIVVAR